MNPFKILSLACFVLFSNLATGQNFQLNGRISILNSRVKNGPIEYIKDVIIRNELSPDRITDYKGRFELNFIDQDPLSIINLTVEKEGYEVVNKEVLKNISIAENPNIRIFLAKKGKVEKKEKGLLKFSQTLISTRKDSIFHLLNLKAISKDLVLKILEKNLGQKISDEMEAKLLLNQLILDLEEELPDIVYQMASMNLDFASDQYKKATTFFQENQLDKAIDCLDEDELDTSFENILASINKAKDSPESYQKIMSIRTIQIENVIESFELKKMFLKLAFRPAEAEILNEKIARMNALITSDQSIEILKNQNEPEDIVVVDQIVNILLEDTLNAAIADTNWVELEIDKLVTKGDGEEEPIGDPKAKTILETLPNNSESIKIGFDFENTLVVIKDVEPNAIPIYEQPTPVLVSSQKPINSSPGEPIKVNDNDVWLAISEKIEQEPIEESSPSPTPIKEIKKVVPKSEKNIINEIVEPNYPKYKITKKTSLRQRATASSKVLKRLKVGTEVKVIDQVDRYWSKVNLNGKIGYVKVLLLEKSK